MWEKRVEEELVVMEKLGWSLIIVRRMDLARERRQEQSQRSGSRRMIQSRCLGLAMSEFGRSGERDLMRWIGCEKEDD